MVGEFWYTLVLEGARPFFGNVDEEDTVDDSRR